MNAAPGTSPANDTGAKAAALLALAGDMAPAIAERAAHCEALRRLPEETDRAFRDAGFYRVLQPARFGGMELDYGVQTDLAAEIGRGCASSAWVLSILASHGWILGMFPASAQEELWARTPDATVATSFLPREIAVTRERDGARLRGRWGFSSGVDYCAAAIVMTELSPEPGAPPEPTFALLPRSDYAIEDTWRATGLAGTGSNDIVVADAFVPEHRLLPIRLTRCGATPGSTVNPSHLYRLPLFAVFPFNLIGPAIGAARGMLDSLAGDLRERRSVARTDLGAQQSVQLRVAKAAALIDSAQNGLLPLRAEINSDAREGQIPSIERRAGYRLSLAHAAQLCVDAVDHLYPLLGGRGLAVGNAGQRAWRDVHAVTQHLGLVWDVQAGLYGAVRLGHPCPDPKL